MSNLGELIERLREARRMMNDAETDAALAVQAMWETVEGKTATKAKDALVQAREAAALADDDVRVATMSFYHETGNKHPATGVNIRIKRLVHYAEGVTEDAAIVWCRQNAPALLTVSLNHRLFEQLVLEGIVAKTIAMVTEMPEVTIAIASIAISSSSGRVEIAGSSI